MNSRDEDGVNVSIIGVADLDMENKKSWRPLKFFDKGFSKH